MNFFGHLFPLSTVPEPESGHPVPTGTNAEHSGAGGLSPGGSQLIVTTKADGNGIDVFRVGGFGELSPSPVINVQPPSTVPFAITFDGGHLVIGNAGQAR